MNMNLRLLFHEIIYYIYKIKYMRYHVQITRE